MPLPNTLGGYFARSAMPAAQAGYEGLLANPAVDEWRMGLGQRTGELINDPAGFYKSAVMDVVPSPRGLLQSVADPMNIDPQTKERAMNMGLLGATGLGVKIGGNLTRLTQGGPESATENNARWFLGRIHAEHGPEALRYYANQFDLAGYPTTDIVKEIMGQGTSIAGQRPLFGFLSGPWVRGMAPEHDFVNPASILQGSRYQQK